jgi:hypothetical protein
LLAISLVKAASEKFIVSPDFDEDSPIAVSGAVPETITSLATTEDSVVTVVPFTPSNLSEEAIIFAAPVTGSNSGTLLAKSAAIEVILTSEN